MALPVLEISTAGRDAIEFARRFPERFARALMPAAQAMAETIASGVVESQFGGDPLNTITGTLWKSVTWRALKIGDSIVLAIGVIRGPATAYAKIQEEGGTVRAKPGKALAIPLDAAKTSGGRPRYPLGPRDPKLAAHYPATFIKKSPGKAPVIYGIKVVAGGGKRRGKLVPLFALVKSVRIIPTNWLSEGVLIHLDAGREAFNRKLNELLFAA